MTGESKPFRDRQRLATNPGAPQVKCPATPLARVRDSRAKSLPAAPVREQASGKYRTRQGGRRGR
jgi:hypothetical protein